jgi:hypothetical protein
VNTVPLQHLEQAERHLSDALRAAKAARQSLGEHWISKSHIAEITRDIYHARMAIAGEIRGRERLGEVS